MRKASIRQPLMVMSLLIGIGVCLSLAIGARVIPIDSVIQALTHNDPKLLNHIVVLERIPRTVFAIIAGAALGISGVLMQSLTRNPIADPSILGVNTGACLSVVIGMTFFRIGTPTAYIAFAIVGALMTALWVFKIGSMGPGGATPIKLALAGAATSAALSSLVTALVMPRTEVMNQFRFWQVGSVSGATWEGILALGPFLIVGFLLALVSIHPLDAIALGDELATGLGAKIGMYKAMSALAGVLLCGAVTALAGPIGFVGLMVPHVVRMVLGPSLKRLLPFSALGGSILLLYSDILGRVLARPGEMEVGIITAFVGAPVLIYIARKAKVTI